MMNIRTSLFTFLLLTSTLFATAQTQWKVSSSSVAFKIKNAGIKVDGSFGGFTGDIKFDVANYTKSSIEASVDANTINTGIELRNKHLKKEEYFDVANHPKISMKSVSFTKNGDGSYSGLFKLTLKGITKDINVPFTYSETSVGAVFKGSFSFDRRDFNVGKGSIMMSDNVTVIVIINAVR